MFKCKYAGDPNDACCAECNGVDFVDLDENNKEITVSCEECGGYEPGEESVGAVDAPANVAEEPNEAPVDADVPKEVLDMPWKTKTADITEAPKPVPNTAQQYETETYDLDTSVQNKVESKTKCSCGGKCDCHVENIEISAGTGISIELNGVWYKFDYSEKRTVNPNEDINTQRKDLWDTVFNEVGTAVLDTKNDLGLK